MDPRESTGSSGPYPPARPPVKRARNRDPGPVEAPSRVGPSFELQALALEGPRHRLGVLALRTLRLPEDRGRCCGTQGFTGSVPVAALNLTQDLTMMSD